MMPSKISMWPRRAQRAVRLLPILLLALALAQRPAYGVEAADASRHFEQGNAAHAAGRTEEAIRQFEAAIEAEGPSASRYFNLGNALRDGGRLGAARLAYERARWLEPGSADIEQNRSALLASAGLQAESPSAMQRVLSLFGMDGWTLIALGALGLLALLAVGAGIRRRDGTRPPWQRALTTRRAILASAAAFLVLLLAVAGIKDRADYGAQAVVVSEQASMRISPQDKADVVAPLREGALVRIERTFRDYAYVRSADGRAGWTRQSAVTPIAG